ncbi:MAG: S8 family serine peptidase [Bacteroidales bacterium]|nr:S8 family serine peptidase [Bacteroidales bacterium]
MKRALLSLLMLFMLGSGLLRAQSCYWVFFTDKDGATFDPYAYFDAKAIERYRQSGADLYDASNYPLVQRSVYGVNAVATEEVGGSRWLNSLAVMATDEQIERIAKLPYVKRVQLIATDMQMAECRKAARSENAKQGIMASTDTLENQLVRMQGQLFRDKGIDGTGVRIAVFDGGFPNVDKHAAFKHLRDNNRILDTWNFPNKKADVFGWNSHGTMTLSCITGVINGRQLGLATGSEFLLYRTEVEPEPFKEEVWWMQAVERADKHGANIISSSLGYGEDRHFTKDMDGTSYVAKAANMAACKGMLVCNSAGNEGDDRSWKTIITPADADGVICVGGVTDDLEHYSHISFSSYGPSADGRLKPNVCAFGHAVVADHRNLDATTMAFGTSFSCPLTSGFAACAWQMRKGYTAMQMKEEIERSADLYPYFDYAFGYGVPQASYFTEKQRKEPQPTFRFEQDADKIYVVPLKEYTKQPIFFNVQQADGILYQYISLELEKFSPDKKLEIAKSCVVDRTLNVHLDGYTNSFKLSADDNRKLRDAGNVSSRLAYQFTNKEGDRLYEYDVITNRDLSDNNTSKWGANNLLRWDMYYQLGVNVKTAAKEHDVNFWSPADRVGFRLMRAMGRKWYCLGLGLEWGFSTYAFDKDVHNELDDMLLGDATAMAKEPKATNKELMRSEWSLELFQRIRLVPGGSLFHKGLHWDLGVYGSFSGYNYMVAYKGTLQCDKEQHSFRNPRYIDDDRWNWGLTTRFAYDWIGVYARYRMTGIGGLEIIPAVIAPGNFYLHLPRLEAGITINL